MPEFHLIGKRTDPDQAVAVCIASHQRQSPHPDSIHG